MKKADLQKKLAELTGESVDDSLTVAELKEAIGEHEDSQEGEVNKGGRPKKKKYRARSLLTFEGKNYKPGDEIPLEIISRHPRLEKLIKSRLVEVS